MIYMLDTANLKDIERAYKYYPLEGVTTNPTIISKENRDFLGLLKDIRKIIGNETMLHVQVLSEEAEGMIKEAKYLNDVIGGNLYIKVPVTKEGIRAMKTLKEEGIKITATAIFTASQALMAAKAGASFVAPYVNRIDNISGNGVEVVKDNMKELEAYNLDCKVLAASFKNVQQVHELSKIGVHSVTVNPEIMDKLLEHPLTDWSVEQFINDWEKVYGVKKTTLDVE
ncbi:MAG: fructose-6-phosphate aldolase [Clostridium sp.]|uniref:fructose-6-phosphate aldolase n=1 Tax=Clostridium sp. TaxID=1506 RepID=UPI003F3363E4